MRIETTKAELAAALRDVKPAIRARNGGRTVFQCVLLEVNEGGAASVRGCNFQDFKSTIEVNGMSGAAPGAAVVRLATLEKAVKRAKKDAAITLEVGPGSDALEVTAGGSSFSLVTELAEDFPRVERPPEDALGCELAADALLELVGPVLPAASRDASRPVLCAVRFFQRPNVDRLEVAACDSYRLHVNEVPADSFVLPATSGGEVRELMVPAEVVAQVVKAIGRHKPERVRFRAWGDMYRLDVGPVSFTGDQAAGQFPNVEQLWPEPKAFKYAFALDREALRDAVGAVREFGEKHSPRVSLTFEHAGPELVVACGSPDMGEARETLGVAVSDGPDEFLDARAVPFELGANGGFLLDALDAVGGELVTLGAISGRRPMVFSGDGASRVLLMPIRKQGR